MKRIVKILGGCIAVIIVLTAVVTIKIMMNFNGSKLIKSDCIIILGCKVNGVEPSPFLKKRTEEGIRLYNKGYAKYIIVSGGKGKGEDITEAEAMKRYMLSKGISESVILVEDKSSNTWTNITNSKKIMVAMGFKNAIIVSNKYHLGRVALMVKKLKLSAGYSGVFNTKYKFSEISGFIREIPAIYKFYIFNK